VCRPRRPRASPLYGLLERRFRHLSLVYDERFAPTYGPWRAAVPTVVAMDRLTYDPATEQLTNRSDKADGPTAGTAALDQLEVLARRPHPHPRSGPGDDPLLRLVRQPDPGDPSPPRASGL